MKKIIVTGGLGFIGSHTCIELIHAGGTPPFSYSINGNPPQNANIFSNLSAGYQNITVTDSSGCTTQVDTNLYQPIPIQSIVKTQNISCFGDSTGAITVTASNGNAPYTYSINGSLPQTSGQFVSLSAVAKKLKSKLISSAIALKSISIKDP